MSPTSESTEAMLTDRAIAQAIAQIVQRAERQEDDASLERTYVDPGVLPQLENPNHQILFGRRGTGKSHVLLVLARRAQREGKNIAAYVDMRLLGSALSMADTSRPLTTRCINLFKDLLIAIFDRINKEAANPERDVAPEVWPLIDDLGFAITAVARISTGQTVSEERKSMTQSDDTARAGVRGMKIDAGIESTVSDRDESKVSQTYSELFENNLLFLDVYRRLDEVLKALEIKRFYLLLDEWSAIPGDIQPLVAEFLKRSVMASPRMTVKIASLEYRSRLNAPLGHNAVIGFEVGGDVSAILDLDDYYVYDRNPDQVVDAFAELLLRHVENELPEGYLAEKGISSASQFRQKLFSDRETFVELVRASEGVVRDFINILNGAFFDALRRGRTTIDLKAVRSAAQRWYETDKSVNLTPSQHRVLKRIITEVIGNKKSRSFMLERDHGRNSMVQSLFDFRVLHLMSKGYSDKDNPGVRYNIYNLDYGTYVDLIQTKKDPTLGLFEDEEDGVVPFDDKRRIRRIILDPAILTDDD